MGRGDGVVTLVGIKTVVRRRKTYRYFRAKGAPMIRLPDLPIDHPDFLRAYADARIVKIAGGSVEIMKTIIAREMFKGHRKPARKQAAE